MNLKITAFLLILWSSTAVANPAARPPTPDPTYALSVPAAAQTEPLQGASAQWIWTANVKNNQVIGLRRTFQIDGGVTNAVLTITADNYFTAYLNGQEIGHTAPNGNDLLWQNVQRYDVTKLLKPGRNVLAVRGENAGDAAGAVALLRYTAAGRRMELVTDAGWKGSETLPDGWQAPSFDDAAWTPAVVQAPLQGGAWGGRLNDWPGLAGTGAHLRRLDLPVKAVISAEGRQGKIAGAETLVGTGTAALKIVPPPVGTAEAESPAVMLDFGQETSGRVEITNASTEPVSITLRYGESADEAREGPYTGVQKLTIPGGSVGNGMDSAFRYAIVTVLAGPADGVVISRIRLNMDYYPVQYLGSFDCSDPLLTRIWYVGAYTSHLSMQDDIWDAPKRDRARWMGDLQVSGEVINNVFLDRFLMERTMDRLRAEAGAPANGHVNGIPGYSCAWVVGMADFYRHTGDKAYLERHHDDLISIMDFFKGELDDRGLFANKRGKWDFVDWSVGFNGGGPHSAAATHFFMIRMLRDGAWMLESLGDTGEAARFRRWADDATAAAQKYLLDPATNTFGDRWQDNAMAIYSGTATPQQREAIWNKVLSHPYPENEFISPYYNNYDISAMSEAGHTSEAVDFVRSYWGGMIEEGATTFWEGYDPRWPKEHFHRFLQADNGMGYFVSLCHGWSSGPTNLLTERVLGVRSTGPGFSAVDIRPELSGLRWASGAVPTPAGIIRVNYQVQGKRLLTDIDVPTGIAAAITLPGKTRSRVQGRHFHATTVLADTEADLSQAMTEEYPTVNHNPTNSVQGTYDLDRQLIRPPFGRPGDLFLH